MNAEKLGQIVEVLARVKLVLDGGYHYSSPILRSAADSPNQVAPVLRAQPNAVALIGDLAEDLETVSLVLFELHGKAKELDIDTRALVSADLEASARAYEQLAKAMREAAFEASEALVIATQPAKPERKKITRVPKASQSSQLDAFAAASMGDNPETLADA